MERLLPLMNGDRLREWVRLGKTLRGNGILRGGDEGVILLMRTFPFLLSTRCYSRGRRQLTRRLFQ
jgi:hypothetical protein